MCFDLDVQHGVITGFMGGAVEEGKRLLLAINDLRGGAGGGKVRRSAEGGVGDAGGQRRPPIKRNLLLTQLTRQQRYRQAEGDRERLGQSARVRDSRQLLKAVPAEKPASRGLKDAQRQLVCVKVRFAAVNECFMQQLHIRCGLAFEKGGDLGMQLAATLCRYLGHGRRANQVMGEADGDTLYDHETRPLEL